MKFNWIIKYTLSHKTFQGVFFFLIKAHLKIQNFVLIEKNIYLHVSGLGIITKLSWCIVHFWQSIVNVSEMF